MRGFRLTLGTMAELAAAAIRGQMQYRANFLFEIGSGMAFQGIGFLFIWAVLERFNAIGGWTLAEIGLIYGIRLTAHGVFQVCIGGLMRLDDLVKSGEFDRYVIRPIHPLLLLMCMAMRMSTLGDLLGGIALLIVVLPRVAIDWTPGMVALLVLAIVGGALIEASLQIIPSTLAFSYLESWPIIRITDDVLSSFGNYPLHIFQQPIRWLLTFVIPMAFIAYLPACALLRRDTFVPTWTAWLTPLIGVGLVVLAVRVFSHGMRNYQSAGN